MQNKGNNMQCNDKANAVRLGGSDDIVKVLKTIRASVDSWGLAIPDLVVRNPTI